LQLTDLPLAACRTAGAHAGAALCVV
jgi:hypothetical protein